MVSSYGRGDSGWILGGITSQKGWSGTRTAQGDGGVTDPGGVQGETGCCVEVYGLVGAISNR